MPTYGTVLDPLAAGPDQCVEFALTGNTEGATSIHRGSILLTTGKTLHSETRKRVRDHTDPPTAFSALDSTYTSSSSIVKCNDLPTLTDDANFQGPPNSHRGIAMAPVGAMYNFPRKSRMVLTTAYNTAESGRVQRETAIDQLRGEDILTYEYQTYAQNLRENVAFGGVVVDQHGDLPVKDGNIVTGDPRARVAAQMCGTTTIPFRMPYDEREHLKVGNPVYIVAYPKTTKQEGFLVRQTGDMATAWRGQRYPTNREVTADAATVNSALKCDTMSFTYLQGDDSTLYARDPFQAGQAAFQPAQEYAFCVDATFHVLRRNGGSVDPTDIFGGLHLGPDGAPIQRPISGTNANSRDMQNVIAPMNAPAYERVLDMHQAMGTLDQHSTRATPGPVALPFTLKRPTDLQYTDTADQDNLRDVYNWTELTHDHQNQSVRKQDSPVMVMKIGTVLKIPDRTRDELTILLAPHQPWLPTSFIEGAYWNMYPRENPLP